MFLNIAELSFTLHDLEIFAAGKKEEESKERRKANINGNKGERLIMHYGITINSEEK